MARGTRRSCVPRIIHNNGENAEIACLPEKKKKKRKKIRALSQYSRVRRDPFRAVHSDCVDFFHAELFQKTRGLFALTQKKKKIRQQWAEIHSGVGKRFLYLQPLYIIVRRNSSSVIYAQNINLYVERCVWFAWYRRSLLVGVINSIHFGYSIFFLQIFLGWVWSQIKCK